MNVVFFSFFNLKQVKIQTRTLLLLFKFQDAFGCFQTSALNRIICAASGVETSKWSGDSVVGELLPSVQGRCVCQSGESIWDSGEPGCLPCAATGSKPGNYHVTMCCLRAVLFRSGDDCDYLLLSSRHIQMSFSSIFFLLASCGEKLVTLFFVDHQGSFCLQDLPWCGGTRGQS